MTGKKIAILTTGGRENGLGHLSRMEELRRELLRRGNEVFFAVHDTGGVSLLKDIFVTSWHLNLEELLTLTSSFDVAVVDSYYAEEECFQALASKTRIAIDDYERIHYPVDAVIRPSIFVWGEKTIQNAKVFEGPEFIVVGEDAKKIRRDVEGDALFISAGVGCNEGVLDVFCEAAFRAGVRKVFVVCGNSRKDICRKYGKTIGIAERREPLYNKVRGGERSLRLHSFLAGDQIQKNQINIAGYMSNPGSRVCERDFVPEESPGSTGQGCRITSGGGDPKDSATENNRCCVQ